MTKVSNSANRKNALADKVRDEAIKILESIATVARNSINDNFVVGFKFIMGDVNDKARTGIDALEKIR